MKRIVLLTVLVCSLAFLALAGAPGAWGDQALAAETWVTCRVAKVGPYGDSLTKAALTSAKWTGLKWFHLSATRDNEMLAVLLSAIASNRQVDILPNNTDPDQIFAVYLRND